MKADERVSDVILMQAGFRRHLVGETLEIEKCL